MRRRVLAFVAAALVGHALVILAAPRVIMAVAMDRLSRHDALVNRFAFMPRIDAAARAVVRPSPDLAYAACVYDLGAGPILVAAGPSADHGYVSLSVFAANTDMIAVQDSFAHSAGMRFVLALPDQVVPAGLPVVRAIGRRGVILDRRLAPDPGAFAAAAAGRRGDRCARLS